MMSVLLLWILVLSGGDLSWHHKQSSRHSSSANRGVLAVWTPETEHPSILAMKKRGSSTMGSTSSRSSSSSSSRRKKKEPDAIVIFHIIDNANWGEVDGSGIAGKFDDCFVNSQQEMHMTRTTTGKMTQQPICEMITSDTITSTSDHQFLLSSMSKKFQQRLGVVLPSSSSSNSNNNTSTDTMTLTLQDIDSHHNNNLNMERTTKYSNILTVGLYHIHTWVTLSKGPHHKPDTELLPTDFTMVESEESSIRFKALFDRTFKWFDGTSTTHPSSTIQRYYFRGWNQSEFLTMKPFQQLIHGAAFVASTCHRGEWQSKRQQYVRDLRSLMIRVDGLGRCLHTPNIPEGIVLSHKGGGTDASTNTPTVISEQEHLHHKRQAISNYMFYLALENTNEPGYVTEKVFDALLAGIVPVYLGASEDCRKLLPHSKAAIFVDDFDYDMNLLSKYLLTLMSNETAYEEHRAWRKDFQKLFSSKGKDGFIPMGESMKSWPCRICQWAREKHMQDI